MFHFLRFLVRVSYLEIYNEEVRDLLNKKSKEALKIRERPDVGVYVKDLLSFVVKDTEEMEKLMSIGNKNSEREREREYFVHVHVNVHTPYLDYLNPKYMYMYIFFKHLLFSQLFFPYLFHFRSIWCHRYE